MLHRDLDIIALVADDASAQRALQAGATRTLMSGPGAVEALAQSDGGRVLGPRMTPVPILEQGVDAVFDCVGSSDTIDLSLHLLRSTGTLVLIGAAGKQSVDWSLVWNRRLTIAGTCNFGVEHDLGGIPTIAQTAEWLSDEKFLVDGLVTHTFGIDEYRDALAVASAGPRAGCVKATLRPNPGIPLVR